MPSAAAGTTPKHSLLEDAQALLTGTLLASFGTAMLAHAGLVTGGIVGIAFLLHYVSSLGVGLLVLAINLPFYFLAWRRKGWRFTLKTCLSVGLFACFADILPAVFNFGVVAPAFAAVMGGTLIGVGMLILFRHGASLGGFNILALYLQDRFGWRAGLTQLVIDITVLIAALAVIPPERVAISIAAALVLNLLLAINHRPERYRA